MSTSSRSPYLFVALSSAFILLSAGANHATAQVFLINTNQSSVTISGTALGGAITNQGPGSLTGTMGGTIRAVVSGSTIQFIGDSQLLSETNGSWQPKANGDAGSDPADFGAKVDLGFASGVAALRNIQLDVVSPVVPLNGGQFDSSSLTFLIPTNAQSSLAYRVTGLVNKSGAAALSGYGTNKIATLSSLTMAGNQQVLRIPVDATFLFKLVTANDTVLRLQGQLVATASASSSLSVQSVAVQGQQVLLQWQANSGDHVQIQFSTDLLNWVTNQTIEAPAQGTYSWTGAVSGPSGFFRLAK